MRETAAQVKELLVQTIATSPGADIVYAEIYDAADLTDVEEINRPGPDRPGSKIWNNQINR